MRILVYGAGAIGMAFGGFLSRDHEVTLLGRKKHALAVIKKGLRVTGIWGRHCFRNLSFVTDVAQLSGKSFDLVLVTVKSFDTGKNAAKIKKLAGKKALVLSLQNGLGNIEALHEVLPKNRVLAGRVIFGVEVPDAGKIKVTVIAHPTAVGETSSKKVTRRVKEIVRSFNRAGLPSVSTAHVQSLLWSKVIYNAALNPLASILGCHYGKLAEEEQTRTVMDEVIYEIYDVARKARIRLTPATPGAYARDFYDKLVPRTYNHHPSMLQDLRAGRKTEIRAINGAVVKLAELHKMDVPVNLLLTEMILQEENNAR